MYAEALVFASEITLASYPILIKQVPTNLWTQVVSRMGVYGLMSFLAMMVKEPGQLTKIIPTQMAGAGLLNLLHVGTSYKAFKDLPAGNAMSIFYAYPIWNLLGAWIFLGEKIAADSLVWVGMAVAGMVMIAQPDVGSILDTKHPFALLCAVLSGVTESAIYFYFKILGKNEQGGTLKRMFELYGGSFFLILMTFIDSSGLLVPSEQMPKLDLSWKVWMPMLLFNGLVGFGGYLMRFTAIPLVSTLIFSMLSLFGIVAAFIFGYLFEGEKPSWMALAGSALIVVANGVLISKNGG